MFSLCYDFRKSKRLNYVILADQKKYIFFEHNYAYPLCKSKFKTLISLVLSVRKEKFKNKNFKQQNVLFRDIKRYVVLTN